MRSLYIPRSLLGRNLLLRPSYIVKRHKSSFSSRPGTSTVRNTVPETPARTRFAPSPTGYLHIGSLRTALYNYLLAKKTGGQFLLRLEDTDQARLVPDAESRLYEDLKWAGLSWDEGPDIGGQYGPYKQSERLDIYKKYADQLINDGRAYRCFCTPEDLDQLKALNLENNDSIVYPGTCLHISPDESARRAANGEQHCVRFKCDRLPPIHDLVYGQYKKPPGEEEDFIIIKQDGYPTYHFANVVDDYLMKITHVIRGTEWLISTPRHVALYEALGWPTPQFAHLGLLTNREKQKLSKRQGDTAISSWRDRGILPVALLNYVMLLGWSPPRDAGKRDEVMNMEEMIGNFHLSFTKGNVTINDKINFLQRSHVRLLAKSDPQQLLDLLLPRLVAHVEQVEQTRKAHAESQATTATTTTTTTTFSSLATEIGPLVPLARPNHEEGDGAVSKAYLGAVLALDVQNGAAPPAFLDRNAYLVWKIPDSVYAASLDAEIRALLSGNGAGATLADATAADTTRARVSELVAVLRDLLRPIGDGEWTKECIDEALTPFVTSPRSAPRDGATQAWGYHLLRWIVAAMRPGPALYASMAVLGRAETLRRVEQAYGVARGGKT
ncbi:hypothetical protein F4779DRAFT_299087 [Xylariaceae sp. FL0662B]|nr:hypothetical protein F4779DRAFT_299087 [Xylariaceae sp. FL0662B]